MTKRTTATQRTVLLETISDQGDMHIELLSTTLAALIVDAGLPDLGHHLGEYPTTVRSVDAPALEALVKLAELPPRPVLVDLWGATPGRWTNSTAVAMGAGDPRVLVNGRPLDYPFRILSEQNFQLAMAAVNLLRGVR